jgi:XapX domain-containing protein
MKMYLVALSVGILVGITYGLLDVRSPAPPVVALIGLLGMLVGEQVVPVAKRLLAGQPITAAWVRSDCVPHVFGPLPARPEVPAQARADKPADRPT